MISALVLGLATLQNPGKMREVEGMILSVRGNIYVIRPSLRPKITRTLIGPDCKVVGFSRTTLRALKPGMRIGIGGNYDAHSGFKARFIDSGWEPLGYLVAPDAPLPTQPGFGIGFGTLKSVSPFMYTTKTGKNYKADISGVKNIWSTYRQPRQGLLIGTHVKVTGTVASDGVIKAISVEPDRNSTRPGTMFATVVSVSGRQLIIQPKYSSEKLPVTLSAASQMLKEHRIDPESIRVGDPVTLWVQSANDNSPRKNEVIAIAVLKGSGRYPQASGNDGGTYLSGAFTQLEPEVFFQSGGKKMKVVVPAQVIVARLTKAMSKDLSPGQPAMFTLKPALNGGWIATYVVLDASAWVGYGG